MMEISMKKIRCPYCGYEMPIYKTDESIAKDIFVKCKGKHCKKIFEIKIANDEIK